MEGQVDETTRILIDYNCIKEVIQAYDHQVILNANDPMVECLSRFQEVIATDGDPTSELLAALIAQQINEACRRQNLDARVIRIRVWESTSCYAECTYEDQ